MTRIISGILLAGSVTALLLYGTDMMFVAVVELLCVGLLLEYFGMLKKGNKPASPITGITIGALLPLALLFKTEVPFPAVMALATGLIVIVSIFNADKKPFQSGANSLFGSVYIGLAMTAMLAIVLSSSGNMIILVLIAGSAFSDISAYYTGKNFGKRPLAPAISPNKTIEGFVGGVIGAVAGTFITSTIVGVALPYAIGAGIVTGFFGPMGDLVESAIKRDCGVKDSGNIIPGHGGLFDRLDAILMSSIFFYPLMLVL